MRTNFFFIGTKRIGRATVFAFAAAMICALLLLFGSRATIKPAHAAAIFTVNSTGDTPDANPGDGTCQTATASECTLRAAIQEANETDGADTIDFAIPGAGPHTISPDPDLPPITEQVTIDGYTQGDGTPSDPSDDATENTQAVGNDAVLKIELDGTNASNGLRIWPGAAGSTVKGLIINRFSNPAVTIDTQATGNFIEGNFIGTNADGTEALANAENGVLIGSEADNNTIGGTPAEAGNIISGNGGNGVEVNYYRDPNHPEDNDPTPPVGNRILSNSIYDNDALGIDLVIPPNDPPGVTANGARDPDTGPNDLQNFPVLTSATTTTIKGTLNSTPNTTFNIQFFSSPQADASGFGEGKQLIAEQTVTTSADTVIVRKKKKKKRRRRIFIPGGDAAFEVPVTVLPGQVVTATATRLDASATPTDTSEFSEAVTVTTS